MEVIKNQKINIDSLVKVLFYGFPVVFIVSSGIVNAHLVLFIIFSLILIKKNNLVTNINLTNLLPFIFFACLMLSTFMQHQELGLQIILKSIFLIRFAFLIFVIKILTSNKIIDLKKFFLVSLFCTAFVSFDNIFQYIFGYDVLGIEPRDERISGIFGEEAISGGYIRLLSLFSIFYIYIFFKNKKLKYFLLFLIILLHVTGIFVSSNRMPMLLFLFSCVLIVFFVKNFRIVTSCALIAFITIAFNLLNNDDYLQYRYRDFIELKKLYRYDVFINKFEQKIQINEENEKTLQNESKKQVVLKKNFFDYSHGQIYLTAIETWKERPLFGNGVKSFRTKCQKFQGKTRSSNLTPTGKIYYKCSTHPHNYYLEILNDGGLVCITLLLIYFLTLLRSFYYYLKINFFRDSSEIYVAMPIIITFLVTIWPIQSTGGVLSTWTGTFFWLIVALANTVESKK